MSFSKEYFNYQVSLETIQYGFSIDQFSILQGELRSQEISLHPYCYSAWQIVLKVWPETNKMFVRLERLDRDVHHDTIMDIICVLKNSDYVEITMQEMPSIEIGSGIHTFDFPEINKPSTDTLRDNIVQLCSDGALCLNITFCFTTKCVCTDLQEKTWINGNSQMEEDCVKTLQRDFSNIFANENLTDVVFNIGKDSVKAHKSVICARSPVFRQMFESNMQESIDSTIKVVDVEKHHLVRFLKFLYSGAMEDCEVDEVKEMYCLADKYNVESLLKLCRQRLSEKMSKTNACSILNLANFHSDESLEKNAMDFICDHFREVEPTEDWELIINNYPRLATRILICVTDKIKEPCKVCRHQS